MKFSRYAAAAIALLCGAALQAQTPSPVVGGETLGSAELVRKACAEGQVVLYTSNSDTESRAMTQTFEKSFPCIKVLTVSAVTGRLVERLQSEASAGKTQADVVTINDLLAIDAMIQKKMVRPWNSPLADKYPATGKLPGYWYAAAGTMLYPVYNSNLVKDSDAPKSWADLLDPKWQGKIAAPTISIGGTGWLQYRIYQDKLGEESLKKLAAQNMKFFTAYQPMTLAVARGEFAIGLSGVSAEYPLRVGQGAPLKPIYPTEGVVVVPAPMFLMAGSPNPNAAELFGNWSLSKAGQQRQVDVRGIWSQRSDVGIAPGNPPSDKLGFWNPGAAVMTKDYQAFAKKVNTIFGTK
jgi:iron(III) transport system substrate-binding protein